MTGVNDDVDDDDQNYTIVTAPASSDDPKYHGMNGDDVAVNNIDDDTVGITVSDISGTTNEAGGQRHFYY